jgi:hypothetical protein
MFIRQTALPATCDKAILESVLLPQTSGSCLRFYYHSFLAGLGSLRATITEPNGATTVAWELIGDQGDSWKEAAVPIVTSSTYRVNIYISVSDR